MRVRVGKRSMLMGISILLLFCCTALADSSPSHFSASNGWQESGLSRRPESHTSRNWYRDGEDSDGQQERSPIAVPEPASITLAGIGLLGLLGAIRQKVRA
jgi:PEP-CTERM motif